MRQRPISTWSLPRRSAGRRLSAGSLPEPRRELRRAIALGEALEHVFEARPWPDPEQTAAAHQREMVATHRAPSSAPADIQSSRPTATPRTCSLGAAVIGLEASVLEVADRRIPRPQRLAAGLTERTFRGDARLQPAEPELLCFAFDRVRPSDQRQRVRGVLLVRARDVEEAPSRMRSTIDLDDPALGRHHVVTRVGVDLQVATVVQKGGPWPVSAATWGEVEHELAAIPKVGPQEAAPAAIGMRRVPRPDAAFVARHAL